MKHYRILERKDITKVGSIYIIQYSKPLIFGLFYWKDMYVSGEYMYSKYDAALTAVKKIISQEDYETPTVGYHYIDAYKIFKTQKK